MKTFNDDRKVYIIPKACAVADWDGSEAGGVDFISNRTRGFFKAHQTLWINKAKMDVTRSCLSSYCFR